MTKGKMAMASSQILIALFSGDVTSVDDG